VFGVSVATLRDMARKLGRSHELASALWDTGWYEARMLAGFVDEPARVTASQMDAWAADFDNWAICDHSCFHLFDRTPHAWAKVKKWSTSRHEFVKRASFALLASVAAHDRDCPDTPFVKSLRLIEREATDSRNFVKKGVSWALRVIGCRNAALRKAALTVARRLAKSDDPPSRWIDRDALRQFAKRAPRAT
jgi:3-methyladenine DNA glycosylase AlkD